MATNSAIEWTETTWNPVTGCSKMSVGCQNCYAEVMTRRLQAMGVAKYADGFAVRVHKDLLKQPLTWRSPRFIFVNSMSDLFHSAVPAAFIKQLFSVMREAHWHTFQILTKRSERLAEMADVLPWPKNVWVGVTVEREDYAWRIDHLRRVAAAAARFVSFEPLLGPVTDVSLDGVDWVIVGGESGRRARPMKPEWARGLRDQSIAAGAAFFFKQWGGPNKKKAGRVLDGRTWDQMPELRGGKAGRVSA